MPEDKREFITLPTDIHRHPVVQRLAPEVRWTFVEMNIEALRERNDGRFTVDDAEFLFQPDHLKQLVESHPRKPLVTKTKDHYTIREYAKHQLTNALREERSRTNRENGSKGGRPRKNPPKTDSVTDGLDEKASRNRVAREPNPDESRVKKSEVRSQKSEPLTITHVTQSRHVTERARNENDSNDELPGEEKLAGITTLAGLANSEGINTANIRRALNAQLGIDTTDHEAAVWVYSLMDKAKGHVKSPTAYAIRTVKSSGPEVTDYFNQLGTP